MTRKPHPLAAILLAFLIASPAPAADLTAGLVGTGN